MGGVDKHDRLVGQHAIPLISKRGYLRIFFHLLDTALVNVGSSSGQPSKRGVSGTRQPNDATHWLGSKNQSYYHSVAIIRLENIKHPTQGSTRHCQSSRWNWSLSIKCNRSKISSQTLPLRKEDVSFAKLHNVLLVWLANRYTAIRAVGNIYTKSYCSILQ